MNFRIWISFFKSQFLGPSQWTFASALKNLLKKSEGWRDSPLAFSSSSKAGALCTRARQQMEPTNSNDDLLILVEKLFRVMFRFFFKTTTMTTTMTTTSSLERRIRIEENEKLLAPGKFSFGSRGSTNCAETVMPRWTDVLSTASSTVGWVTILAYLYGYRMRHLIFILLVTKVLVHHQNKFASLSSTHCSK